MPVEKRHITDLQNQYNCTSELSSKKAENGHVFSFNISLSLYPAKHNNYFHRETEKEKRCYMRNEANSL